MVNILMKNIDFYMNLAIEEAKSASLRGSVPIGAIIALEGKVISLAGNEVKKNNDPTAHAEMLAIKRACCTISSSILLNCDIYVTLEPCAMCAQAISLARIKRLYFGAYDNKYGGVINGCRVFKYSLHKPEVIGGIRETTCGEILRAFFYERRY